MALARDFRTGRVFAHSAPTRNVTAIDLARLPADDAFELARFGREPTNVTASLIVPTAPWMASSIPGNPFAF